VVNIAGGAGVTVIVLVTGTSALPHASVAVHVSVIVPPQGPGAAENVEVLDVPVIRQGPASPFVKLRVDAVGVAPQAIVMAPGAVIVGNAAGVTVIVLLPLIVLLHASVNVHVSVSVPPQPVLDPVLTAVTVPDIKHEPEAELV
jgi:hypothetical protein